MSTRLMEDPLYRPLLFMGESALEELLGALVSVDDLAGLPVSDRKARVLGLRRWVELDPARRRKTLQVLVATRAPVTADPEAWLDRCVETHKYVPIVGSMKRAALPVERVYVPLALAASAMGEEHLGGRGRWVGGDPVLAAGMDPACEKGTPSVEGAASDLTLEAALAEVRSRAAAGTAIRGLAVVGDPGCGKTTLLKRVFCLARHGGAAVGLPQVRLPVYLRFSRLAELALAGEGLLAMMEAEARDMGFAGAGLALREGGPFLFLLDGLDEVRDDVQRDGVCSWLVAQIESWPHSVFLVTCRVATWRRSSTRPILGSRLITLDVLAFSREDVKRYVGGWFQEMELAFGPPGHGEGRRRRDGQQQAAALISSLYDQNRQLPDALYRMLGNPLLLSILCLVQKYGGGELPRNRARLYAECLRVLLQLWGEVQQRPGGSLPWQDASLVLAPLAWAMQEARGEGDDPTELDEDALLGLLAERLPQVPGLAALSPLEFLDRVSRECGVLLSPDYARYRFCHLTFQEYLAAQDALWRDRVDELAARFPDTRWRETLLLAFGEPSLFGRLLRVALRGDPVRDEPLLRDGLREAASLDPAPLTELLLEAAVALERPLPSPMPQPTAWQRLLSNAGLAPRPPAPVAPNPGPPAAHVQVALRLAQAAGPQPAIQAVATRLARHPDQAVAHLAAQVARAAERPAPVAQAPAPGASRLEPVTGMALIWVPPGGFLMGATNLPGALGFDPQAYESEGPPHRVHISRGFWLGQYPVTNAQYRRFVQARGVPEPGSFRRSGFDGPDQPVVEVSWHDAVAFCAWLNDQARLAGRADLPSEAEWEWAARGPENRRFPWGAAPPDAERACFDDISGGRTAAVGGRPLGAGPFGTQDQAGNVWEWCRDWYFPYGRQDDTLLDPCREDDKVGQHNDRSPPSEARLLRGGAWDSPSGGLRCSCRVGYHPWNRIPDIGFRLVFRPPSNL